MCCVPVLVQVAPCRDGPFAMRGHELEICHHISGCTRCHNGTVYTVQVQRALQLARLSAAATERERDATAQRQRGTENQLAAAEHDIRKRFGKHSMSAQTRCTTSTTMINYVKETCDHCSGRPATSTVRTAVFQFTRLEDGAQQAAAEREAIQREADRKLGTIARRAARQLKDAQAEAARAKEQAATESRHLQYGRRRLTTVYQSQLDLLDERKQE